MKLPNAGGVIPYSEVKDSGIEWLGRVPEHWQVLPGRACFREKKQPNRALQEKTVLSLSYGQIVVKPPEKLHGLVPSSFETYQIVNPLDIIIRPTDLQNDWNSLRFGLSRHRGIITSAYLGFRTINDVTPEYGHLLLHSYDLMKVFYGLGSGLRQNLDWSDFKRLPCSIPPLSEQAAIVRFLDHADRRIRRHIRAKEKLIGLLEEQKQAIINQAVTGKIDVRTGQPYPAYKPSGVEWLGDIPEHWEMRKLKHLTRFQNGVAFKPDDWSSDGVPIIRIQNLNGSGDFNCTVRKDLPDSLLIRPGSLLFSWSGNRGTSFGSYVWDRDFAGYLNQHIFKLEGYSLDRGYFAHLLRAVTNHVEENTHGIIGLVHITKPELGRILVPVAPSEDQPRIAEAIDERLTRLQAAGRRLQRQTELLLEYRTRLIADVVTGKIDVRQVAATLPEVDPLADEEDLDDTLDIDPGAEDSELDPREALAEA